MHLRIGLDVDGVMYQWDKTARYMLRTEFGYPKDGPLGQPATHWNAIQEHVDPKHWNWLWNSGVKNGLFRYGHLYKGTIEAVRALAALGDCVVITHRPKSAVQDTLDWLSYLRLPFREIHLLTGGEPKSEVPHCDIYIDDKPDNCVDFNDHTEGLPLMWRRPWNAHFDTNLALTNRYIGQDRIQPVSTWQEVIYFADRLSGQRQRAA